MDKSLDDLKDDQLTVPMQMVQWWEKKRFIYNAIIILFTSFDLYSLWDYFGPILTESEAIFQAIWFIILANIFYTSGWAGGILRYYYFRSYPLSNGGRWILFGLGSFFSIIVIYIYFVFASDVLFAD